MIDYFPVTVPYRVGPTMAANEGPAFVPVEDMSHITSKLAELDKYGSDLFDCRRPDLVEKASQVLGLNPISDIVEFAFLFKEDVAIMHKGVLEAICFCYPSSWIPSERIGQSLAEIHAPVADGELLRQMSQRIAEVIATKSMRRHVWTISTTGELSNHPKMAKPEVTDQTTIEDLYFRMETQTTMPVGDGETAVFLVRVDTCPLGEIWQDPARRDLIIQSVDTMSDNVLQYKNLVKIKEVLNKSIAVNPAREEAKRKVFWTRVRLPPPPP